MNVTVTCIFNREWVLRVWKTTGQRTDRRVEYRPENRKDARLLPGETARSSGEENTQKLRAAPREADMQGCRAVSAEVGIRERRTLHRVVNAEADTQKARAVSVEADM